ncbi:hypothetical protein QAD02_010369 [Eretmocerus hayati]|uniref:Uncharacterized protein n=1 Tax=Eretmocerus hayati TaxID=131215 RepID=A0ACC2NC83_9HYME|nr:hypothetical protein QAD02_010369 [Eretmocerus hayati]
MPAKLSKFLIHATCKEYAHPWTDSCINATTGLGLHAIQDCLRIYSTLYFITLLTKKRIPTVADLRTTFLSILQSTAFLSWSAFAYSSFVCLFRRVLGHFNIFTVSFVPSFFSSLTAILLERPSRRTMLCLYVSNIATETLFRMAVSRGYMYALPRGEIYIFAVGMASLLYFFKSKSNNHDSIFKVIRIALGPYEEKGYNVEINNKEEPLKMDRENCNSQNSVISVIWKSVRVYKSLIDRIKSLGGKHSLCLHPNSCLSHIVGGSFKMFSLGYCLQVGLRSLLHLKSLFTSPQQLRKLLTAKGSLDLAYFLGGFTGLYQLASCILRRMRDQDSSEHAIVASFVASTSFVMYPDNTIALYIMWKALQISWNHGVETKKVPEIKWFVIFLYCFSTAVLFHAAIVEPQNLRISYWKFLYNLSGGRIATMSRIPIDDFGLETSKNLQMIFQKSRTHDKHVFTL